MDVFFISHGSPTLSIDEKMPARHFLKSWKEKVLPGVVPTGILVVSGHWDTSEPTVNVVAGKNETIHDFNGFPKPMYQLKYPAPGAPDLAQRVKVLLQKSGFGKVKEDKFRGLDHGAWTPLMLMYPEANIPVCQLSLQSRKDGTYHYNMGKALAPLREEGVLIIGSGSATHNLRTLGPDGGSVPNWASDFDAWLKESILNGRHEDLNHFEEKAPCAKMAHPWPEHFFPLHVALGAAGEKAKAELIHHSWGSVHGRTVGVGSRQITWITCISLLLMFPPPLFLSLLRLIPSCGIDAWVIRRVRNSSCSPSPVFWVVSLLV